MSQVFSIDCFTQRINRTVKIGNWKTGKLCSVVWGTGIPKEQSFPLEQNNNADAKHGPFHVTQRTEGLRLQGRR